MRGLVTSATTKYRCYIHKVNEIIFYAKGAYETMQENMKVRKLFEEFINSRGVKVKWVAEQLNFNYSNLVQWRKGNREYSDERCKILKIFLEKY
jgi:hypothetical protein